MGATKPHGDGVDRNLVEWSAVDMLTAFRSGAVSPAEVVEACIGRIEAVNPLINAVTATCFARARAEAAEAGERYRAGRPVGPLDGLPIAIKDLQETEGVLTTFGSPIYRGHVPRRDQPIVANLRRAGAIVLAKTNVPEFGAGGNTRNSVWGATGNPFDPNLNAGGSSGGSAAALAVDMVPLCTGSDTGGSLRLPAALCGVVAFRGSPGLVANPTRPLAWSSISVLGPMARTVADMALLLRSCVGRDPDDPLSQPSDPAAFELVDLPDPAGLRIGYSEDFGGSSVDPDIRSVFRARVAAVAPHVAVCEPVDLALGEMDRCFDVLRAQSFVAAFADACREDASRFGPHIRTNIAIGEAMSLADCAWAHLEHTRILRAYTARAAAFDAILTPTTALSPFPWQQLYADEIAGERQDAYYRWLSLTYKATLAGAPAIALPCGRDHRGMPFGLQLLGRTLGDAALLRVAAVLERLFAGSAELCRPRPDLADLKPSTVPLTSLVTDPPDRTHRPVAPARTAV